MGDAGQDLGGGNPPAVAIPVYDLRWLHRSMIPQELGIATAEDIETPHRKSGHGGGPGPPVGLERDQSS